MALLPFEVPFFADYGIPCTDVGHRPSRRAPTRAYGKAFRELGMACPWTFRCSGRPGSRGGEVRHILPVFTEAVSILEESVSRFSTWRFLVASIVAEQVEGRRRRRPLPSSTSVTDAQERFDAFAACDAAMTKSGTITFELALAKVPMVVAYKVNALTAFIVQRMTISVEHASLVNLLAGHPVCAGAAARRLHR